MARSQVGRFLRGVGRGRKSGPKVELAMRALAAVVILLTIGGFALFIYGDVTRDQSLRVAGVVLVALAGIGLFISAAHDRDR